MNIDSTINNLQKNGFHVTYLPSKQAAQTYLVSQLSNRTINLGDSATLDSMNLKKALSGANTVWNDWFTDQTVSRRKAAEADVFITSANAIAQTGEIINIDDTGNRVSSSLYGPGDVYFVVGVNKIAETYDQALWRARNVAAPKNAQRLGLKTPCAKRGDRCYDCQSPDRICRGLVVLWRSMSGAGRMEVVLVDEALGF